MGGGGGGGESGKWGGDPHGLKFLSLVQRRRKHVLTCMMIPF